MTFELDAVVFSPSRIGELDAWSRPAGVYLCSLHIHVGYRLFQIFGSGLEPLLLGTAIMLIYWLVLFWMYRTKIFLRI